MPTQRSLSWNAVTRDLRADRVVQPPQTLRWEGKPEHEGMAGFNAYLPGSDIRDASVYFERGRVFGTIRPDADDTRVVVLPGSWPLGFPGIRQAKAAAEVALIPARSTTLTKAA